MVGFGTTMTFLKHAFEYALKPAGCCAGISLVTTRAFGISNIVFSAARGALVKLKPYPARCVFHRMAHIPRMIPSLE